MKKKKKDINKANDDELSGYFFRDVCLGMYVNGYTTSSFKYSPCFALPYVDHFHSNMKHTGKVWMPHCEWIAVDHSRKGPAQMFLYLIACFFLGNQLSLYLCPAQIFQYLPALTRNFYWIFFFSFSF